MQNETGSCFLSIQWVRPHTALWMVIASCSSRKIADDNIILHYYLMKYNRIIDSYYIDKLAYLVRFSDEKSIYLYIFCIII